MIRGRGRLISLLKLYKFSFFCLPLCVLHMSCYRPLVRTLHTFIEGGHGFVTGPNLNLFKVGACRGARRSNLICALDLRLLHIFPRFSSPKHIIHFFPIKMHLVFDYCFDFVDVGASFAEKAEICQCFLS